MDPSRRGQVWAAGLMSTRRMRDVLEQHRALKRLERHGIVSGALRRHILCERANCTVSMTSAADWAKTTAAGRWSAARFQAWRAWS
jgi:hypothetical protein